MSSYLTLILYLSLILIQHLVKAVPFYTDDPRAELGDKNKRRLYLVKQTISTCVWNSHMQLVKSKPGMSTILHVLLVLLFQHTWLGNCPGRALISNSYKSGVLSRCPHCSPVSGSKCTWSLNHQWNTKRTRCTGAELLAVFKSRVWFPWRLTLSPCLCHSGGCPNSQPFFRSSSSTKDPVHQDQVGWILRRTQSLNLDTATKTCMVLDLEDQHLSPLV